MEVESIKRYYRAKVAISCLKAELEGALWHGAESSDPLYLKGERVDIREIVEKLSEAYDILRYIEPRLERLVGFIDEEGNCIDI